MELPANQPARPALAPAPAPEQQLLLVTNSLTSGSEWLTEPGEEKVAALTMCATFLLALTITTLTGVVALAYAPKADVNFAGLSDATCLRVARQVDYAIVYMDVGSPMQRLKLLLDLEAVVEPGGESLTIFSSRLHKSLTMSCSDLDPPRPYSQKCHDLALVAPNGSSSDQLLVHTSFVFYNDQWAYSDAQPAALAGLDGTFKLTRGRTFWVTATHFCFSPLAPPPPPGEGFPLLNFSVDNGKMVTLQKNLVAFDDARWRPDWIFGESCNRTLENVAVRMFPAEAANEARVWLALSGSFLYEYGSGVLEKRREVVEAGENCSALLSSLEHQRDIYQSDCGLGLGACAVVPSVPFRRFSERRLRVDVPADGQGTIIAEHAEPLQNVEQPYSEALVSAVVRLLVLLLTAAVVFVRGSQNATSSRWLLINCIDTLRCRKSHSHALTPQNLLSQYTIADIVTDAAISTVAWAARLAVLIVMASAFLSDGQGAVVRFQSLGIACSFVHFLLRYCLSLDRRVVAPITTLGGPMSVIDVTSAVLMLFSDAPLLGNSDARFSAIGRLLIGLLVSLSVGTRICFSAALVATMAVSATNGSRKTLYGYKAALVIATILWMLQSVATFGTLALLFVNPAAVALSRSQTGDTSVIKYAIYFGLLCTSLPTFTKVALRVYQHECSPPGDKNE